MGPVMALSVPPDLDTQEDLLGDSGLIEWKKETR